MPDQPLPKASWKRLRISVKGLMVLVLLLGAGLGWSAHRAHVQRNSVSALERAGCEVLYSWQWPNEGLDPPEEPWWPEWLLNGVGVDFFYSVVHVGFADDGSDADMAHVGLLNRLDDLALSGSSVTDAGLKYLEGLTSLEEIRLDGTRVGDFGLLT